jgi:phosphatidylinositol kinase/protein kinase (PI-3  family)
MHIPVISERYGLLLEAYLRGCGTHRLELQKQIVTLKDFVRIANLIKIIKDVDRKENLHLELRKVQFPHKLQLPLNPSMEVNGIIVEKCKYMDSKKLPLWIVLKNADANVESSKSVIFKSGDDLRQDMLTLQMIRLMDKFWKQEGLNLELSPYGCIATGNDEGMIEVVLGADTMANITKNAGGAKAALFREDPLANWIKSHNPKGRK